MPHLFAPVSIALPSFDPAESLTILPPRFIAQRYKDEPAAVTVLDTQTNRRTTVSLEVWPQVSQALADLLSPERPSLMQRGIALGMPPLISGTGYKLELVEPLETGAPFYVITVAGLEAGQICLVNPRSWWVLDQLPGESRPERYHDFHGTSLEQAIAHVEEVVCPVMRTLASQAHGSIRLHLADSGDKVYEARRGSKILATIRRVSAKAESGWVLCRPSPDPEVHFSAFAEVASVALSLS